MTGWLGRCRTDGVSDAEPEGAWSARGRQNPKQKISKLVVPNYSKSGFGTKTGVRVA